jgi:hypothetical protein
MKPKTDLLFQHIGETLRKSTSLPQDFPEYKRISRNRRVDKALKQKLRNT